MQPTAHQDPRRRPDRRGAADNEDPGASAIPIRTPVRGLDRLDAERSFDRGQGQAWRDYASRRRRIAARAGGRGYHGGPECSARRKAVALASRTPQTQVAKVGRRGTGQQDGAHRLETDDYGGKLRRESCARQVGRRSLEISQTREQLNCNRAELRPELARHKADGGTSLPTTREFSIFPWTT